MRRGSKHNLCREEWNVRSREFCLKGEKLPHAKLTEDQVKTIRSEYRRNCRSFGVPALAKKYGLHRRTIEKVVTYETWFHV